MVERKQRDVEHERDHAVGGDDLADVASRSRKRPTTCDVMPTTKEK